MSPGWRRGGRESTVTHMGFLDKAKELIGQHDDKVDQGLDKAGEFAKGKFAGHDEHIDKAVDFAQEKTGEGDTTAPPPPAPEGEQPPPPPA
ncbi:hypothetical protein GCM10009836_66680 [Pseudonocardia ailaonensis]|uniref:Antitoxin protein of toxin-antitoxin system n=2 Tax=Pseudonocardia ailaonensis TaxID=367279 RepID=A0ABN2NPR1_9PSEU